MTACLVFTLASCKREKILGITSMKVVMWDMAKVEGFGLNYLGMKPVAEKDSILKQKYAEVFALHHTSQEQFFASLKYYKDHPNKYRDLIDSLNTYATQQRDRYYNDKVEATATTDTTTAKPAVK
ncbi:MAG TPA: DUF4296 domain-containing protein [Phnomibacter sp.]|nr:DUF4296 domain-containing protein [Phnomibacter sp.]